MTVPKTVFVIGAGSSFGFGLPLGLDLRRIIADDLNIKFSDWGSSLESGSYEIVEALRIIVRTDGGSGDINPHRQAAIQISGSMRLSSSIDEYIERHRNDRLKVECAKLAITKAIFEAERRSTIYADPYDRQDPFASASDTWLAYMLRDLTRGLGKDQIAGAFENISIINFNYDRCVEHFAHHWFQRIYDLTDQESAAVCKNIKIYHPYGYLGPLPWEAQQLGTPFGADISARRLVDTAHRIQTYSEAIDAVSQPGFVKDHLSHVRKIVFLGFGFHRPNIAILGASGSKRATLHCYATSDGIRPPRLEIIKSQLATAMHVEAPNGLFFEHIKGNCEAFWEEFGDVIVQ